MRAEPGPICAGGVRSGLVNDLPRAINAQQRMGVKPRLRRIVVGIEAQYNVGNVSGLYYRDNSGRYLHGKFPLVRIVGIVSLVRRKNWFLPEHPSHKGGLNATAPALDDTGRRPPSNAGLSRNA